MLINPNLKRKCSRFIYHPPKSQQQWLSQMAESQYSSAETDSYGASSLFTELEQRVAKLLNKPAATFISKGVIAQQIALRVHAQNRGNTTIALSPKSHLVVDEDDAYRRLSGLTGITIGSDHEATTLNDLKSLKELPAAVCIELPLRRAGFKAPSFNEISDISNWCKNQQIRKRWINPTLTLNLNIPR